MYINYDKDNERGLVVGNNKKLGSRSRPKKNVYVTKSGRSIKVNQGMGNKWNARKDSKARSKAIYMSGLPTGKLKKILFHLQPKRVFHYWFSKRGLIMGLKLFGIAIVVGFIIAIGMFAYFRKDLPNLKDISGSNLGGSISYYDRTGKTLLFQDYDALKRIPVKGDQINPYMKQATVAVEDKNFYHEGAFDVRGIIRAGVNDVTNRSGGLQGGSTITQQLVKLNQNWTDNRTITRKVKEIILAVDLEREYSKDDILTGYLNIAPYGGIEYGAQAAAQDYFHVSALNLTLAQATMLAAIPKSPDVYSPYSPDFDKNALKARRYYILDQMVTQKYITKQQADAAKKVDVVAQVQPITSKYNGIIAPYFVLGAKHELQQKFGSATVNRGGWKVITTLNLDLQKIADNLIQKNIPTINKAGADEEALVSEDVKTGQMLAVVGGTDFYNVDHGQINYAEQPIPPGSSFKPYDYASLINFTNNSGAGSVLYDVQQPLPGYPCTNKNNPKTDTKANCLWDYDLKYPGALTLRYALAGSRNVPAVKAMLTVGTNKVISTANAMMSAPNAYNCYSDVALSQTTQCYGASAIGDGAYLHLDQHVNGLATLGRLGQAIPNTYILKITDSGNKTVSQWTQPTPKQVIKAESAYIIDNMLSDPNATYLPGSFKFQHYKGWDLAVKTGTTNNGFDGLMTSWSTQLATVSWVGYHTRDRALHSAGMEYLTTPLTKNFMEQATDYLNMKPVNWTAPAGIKTLPAYVIRNHVGIGSVEPSPSTDIFPSWYTPNTKNANANQTTDKVSGAVATTCTPSLAKQDSANANDNAFSSDIFWPIGKSAATSGTNGNSTAVDTLHNCGDTKPSATASATACDTTSGCPISVTVAQGTHLLNDPQYAQYPGTINLLVNGAVVSTYQINSATDCNNGPSCNLTLSWTPPASDIGQAINISVQVIDSVLYDSTSLPITVNVTGPSAQQGNSNQSPGNGGNNNSNNGGGNGH